MNGDLERKLGDLQADGKIADEDAHQVRTFAQYLREAGPRADRRIHRDLEFRRRWMPYLQGEVDGPVEP